MEFFTKVQRKGTKLLIRAKASVFNNGINAFWWTGRVNFGDLFTPELFQYYGVSALESKPEKSDIIGVGSLFGMIPSNFEGVFLGTGLMKDKKMHFEKASFAAVRGEFTRSNLGLSNTTPIGDFGLLANKLISKKIIKKKYAVGFIPHYVDQGHPWLNTMQKYLGVDECTIIDVRNSAENVTKQVAECELILSSSLHGIIVADSLNIPNVWVELSSKVVGDGFKFRDYNTAIDYEQAALKIEEKTKFSDITNFVSDKNADKIRDKIDELDDIIVQVIGK
ncbi:polysaccharide pyruvyl transferase family protein [Colwellia sp. MB02u-18]|uniref:polysaccharide pyruvyl transferase family protein n=1 Tax=unclassified Colwellia TaxID=196834 RepID=UPI0015F4F76D|nr:MULTISPECIES: polysaccharide pyruvyl transferase family protein [unclassified Colwellia]MBA6225829.1 polysaccharide pyruvyl transferase family protein [Colwellia sp. MB3u-45]MBA6267065.1 polysaccharide pyruvyl transferase family protein [Colwellia sp. MB3u-43]MBA6321989.1 polysaccharide pyruvyl transferase family protein [Colwellia sp. MB02u-19]MBA6325219.1 polysaccharide pyruvyl transferase family protein [Colwellia sp. MB02u-18]MBA6330238.1 polysaccharide pyruvyl transferase family protei